MSGIVPKLLLSPFLPLFCLFLRRGVGLRREAEISSGLDLAGENGRKGLRCLLFHLTWGEGGGKETGTAGAGVGMCDKIKAFSLPGPHLSFT